MLNILFKFLSIFKINQTPIITKILPVRSSDNATEMFMTISALNLMLETLNTKQKFYKNLYTKASQELANNTTSRGNTLKQKYELHQIVNSFYDNLLILDKEIKRVEEELKNYSLLFSETYLKLNTKYDTKYHG